MKKVLYIMLFLILGMSMTAQSVWNGKREAISSGSGTESDPYLIENAQQLAWLVYVINWDYAEWTEGKYFLLTTDIDLNGSVDNQWIPIGAGASVRGSKYFNGVLDGGFHKITGLYMENDNPINNDKSLWLSTNAGLFTQLGSNSVVKNLYVEGYITISKRAGGFAGQSSGVFEYCVSNVDVKSTNNPAAGLAAMGTTTVNYCVNLGNIIGKNATGGLVGMNGYVRNSYNMGRIEAQNIVGGIAGKVNLIKNCYNVGEIVGTSNKGAIIGVKSSGSTVSNCYYLEGCITEPNAYGEPKTAEFMRSADFVNLLNNETSCWVMDTLNNNDGYPVFGDVSFGIAENFVENFDLVMVYPNPVVDYVCVAGDVVSCDVFDLVGKRVLSVSTNINKIAVSDLPSGIYMMRFLTKNGNVVTKKVVKK